MYKFRERWRTICEKSRKWRRTIKIGEQLANFAKGSRKKRRAEKSENVENAGERESEKIRGRAVPPEDFF